MYNMFNFLYSSLCMKSEVKNGKNVKNNIK
jgi:hypothetical protein